MASNPDDEQVQGPKKPARKGFQVGPANLPDGPQRRKMQKIKQSLIRKAQLNKELSRARAAVESTAAEPKVVDTVSLEPHPDRQALIEAQDQPEAQPFRPSKHQRKSRPKPQTFNKEVQDAEFRRKELEHAQAARRKALNDRERIRKAVAKARKPGKDGKRKLGRESTVLLEKIKKIMND